jgi:ATP-dependent helicase YprA (DUF1998 family)
MRAEIEHMREALASYIEATYHLSNPKAVELRRRLLTQGGIAQTPYVESTPAYVGERKFASLALDETVRQFLSSLATEDSGQLLFDPPYQHQAQALELAMSPEAGGRGIVVTTGTGSGKTESFLLPVLAKLANEAAHRPKQFAQRAVRALLLYPMNALVNDQLGRLRMLFGASAVRQWFTTTSIARPNSDATPGARSILGCATENVIKDGLRRWSITYGSRTTRAVEALAAKRS